jgi:hypothetical protein
MGDGFVNALGEEITPAPVNPFAVTVDKPTVAAVAKYADPLDGVNPNQLRQIAHDYLNTGLKVDSIAINLGLTTRDVRNAIKTYGLDKKKDEIIRQIQSEELAAYSKFLLDNRVSTAEQHLRISNQLNTAVENVMKATEGKTMEELAKNVKPLRDVAALFRSLGETLAAASGVGARAVALSGLTDAQSGGFFAQGPAGKQPLVTLNFAVQQPPTNGLGPEVIEATCEEIRQ